MKKKAKPKARGVWKINPKTRVKPSKKKYSRKEEQKKARKVLRNLDWFGDG